MEANKTMLPATRPAPTAVFPERLHGALAELERESLMHIAAWQPHGRSFKVYNRAKFADKILPRWFRQSTFASFQRQLNIYGFTRISLGPDQDAYYHTSFLRDQPERLREILRIPVKGRGLPRAAGPTREPNFYETTVTTSNAIQHSNASQSALSVPAEERNTRTTSLEATGAALGAHQTDDRKANGEGFDILEQCRQWQREDAQALATRQRQNADLLFPAFEFRRSSSLQHPAERLGALHRRVDARASSTNEAPHRVNPLSGTESQQRSHVLARETSSFALPQSAISTNVASYLEPNRNALDMAILLQEQATASQNQRLDLIGRLQQQATYHGQQQDALERQALLMQLQQLHQIGIPSSFMGINDNARSFGSNQARNLASLTSNSALTIELLQQLLAQNGSTTLERNRSDDISMRAEAYGGIASPRAKAICLQTILPPVASGRDQLPAEILTLTCASGNRTTPEHDSESETATKQSSDEELVDDERKPQANPSFP